MPINFHSLTNEGKYAQCYRLQELLRLEFNNKKITKEEHNRLEDIVINELLILRDKLKKDSDINTSLNDITI